MADHAGLVTAPVNRAYTTRCPVNVNWPQASWCQWMNDWLFIMRIKNFHTKICMLTVQWRKDENKQQSLAISLLPHRTQWSDSLPRRTSLTLFRNQPEANPSPSCSILKKEKQLAYTVSEKRLALKFKWDRQTQSSYYAVQVSTRKVTFVCLMPRTKKGSRRASYHNAFHKCFIYAKNQLEGKEERSENGQVFHLC